MNAGSAREIITTSVDFTQIKRFANRRLEVEVTNLTSNRIADMDRRKVPWKKFYDINFVSIKYGKFDASD